MIVSIILSLFSVSAFTYLVSASFWISKLKNSFKLVQKSIQLLFPEFCKALRCILLKLVQRNWRERGNNFSSMTFKQKERKFLLWLTISSNSLVASCKRSINFGKNLWFCSCRDTFLNPSLLVFHSVLVLYQATLHNCLFALIHSSKRFLAIVFLNYVGKLKYGHSSFCEG